jgi:hypothetical protein
MTDEATLIGRNGTQTSGLEGRRAQGRLPLSCRILLTPVDDRAAILIHENVSTNGKDLSLSGARFSHDFPLTQRRFLLSFRDPELGGFVVEAEVVWTRTVPNGTYETGCRIIRKMIAPPLFV